MHNFYTVNSPSTCTHRDYLILIKKLSHFGSQLIGRARPPRLFENVELAFLDNSVEIAGDLSPLALISQSRLLVKPRDEHI